MTTTSTCTPIPVEDESHGERPERRHPRLRAHLRPVARQGKGRRDLRGVPPHPVALPGAGTSGEITAQSGDRGRWRRPRRHRSGGLGHDRQPETATTGRRQSPTPGRHSGGHPAAAVRRAPVHRRGAVRLRQSPRHHPAPQAGEARRARPGGLDSPPPGRPGAKPQAPPLSHGAGH